MHQGSIGHLERRMHTVEGTIAVLKNHWTRAEEDIRRFIVAELLILSQPSLHQKAIELRVLFCPAIAQAEQGSSNIGKVLTKCIVENDGVDDVLVEAAVAVTSGEENDGKDDVPEDKGSESVMEGDKDGGEEEDDNE
ncbi:hypothetical protein HID58_063682 [Brassica napus]|uniref:Uncharacterized protein n=1 Tax=Brassica napus TaxID=3708 RepID=A0ABQ7XEY4_BRANA|nr:hypothetical protein HID58_063682 [Brassica napus]